MMMFPYLVNAEDVAHHPERYTAEEREEARRELSSYALAHANFRSHEARRLADKLEQVETA